MEIRRLLRTDEGDVGESSRCVGTNGRAIGAVVAFETVALRGIGNARVANGETELYLTRKTIVCIEVVVPSVVSDEILAVDIATEPLVAVVVGIAYLDVVDLCAATYRTECEAVDFLIGLEWISSKLNADIAQNAGVVGIVVTAVLGARTTLNLHFFLIVLCLAAEDNTAPISRATIAFGLF